MTIISDVQPILFDLAMSAYNGLSISAQMTPVPNSAVPQWSLTLPSSDSIYRTVMLRFIQLLGLIGILKGSTGLVRYFSPEPHPKKPPNVAYPLFQLFFGMLALVPTAVIEMGEDFIARIGF